LFISLYRHLIPRQLRLRKIDHIICDLDGTSLRDDSSLSEEFLLSVRKLNDAGLNILFASGRSESFMQSFYEQCNLRTPIVSLNGSLIRTIGGTLLHAALLPSSSIKRVLDVAEQQYPVLKVVLFTSESAFSTTEPFLLPSYLRQSRSESQINTSGIAYRYEHVQDLSSFADSTVLAVVKGPFMAIQTLSASLAKHFFGHLDKVVYPASNDENLYYMEIRRKHTHKGSAVRALSKKMNISRSRFAAIGDYFNDIEMCRSVSFSGAMQNAVSSLKQKSDFVTKGTNNEDGILEFFQHILSYRLR
jgi:Cof subfamily protein (haloacid dehalogenase superfamily)